MLANRVSFFLGAIGPSLNVDSGFTSSCTALEQAYLSIKKGRCENAIVGGSNLILHPQMPLVLNLAGKYLEISSFLLYYIYYNN